MRRLRARLLLSHLVVALAALGSTLAAVSIVGPGYFAAAMGHRPGESHGVAMDAVTLAAFGDATRAALAVGSIVALATAAALSLALATRIAGPVTRLVAAAGRIAAGDYGERVAETGRDEVGELGGSFNAMAASLEATERRRLELVGDVAHELRTPVATLDAYLEGLEDGVVGSGAETWGLLRRETGRLARLIDDLAELWRAEARQLTMQLTTVDLAEIGREALQRHQGPASERGIELGDRLPASLTVTADGDRVRQVLDNYLSNAIRYGPPGTTITVRGESVGEGAQIGVADQGPGLTQEERSRVFERFYRIDPSRSRALGGSGIGLPIARAVAEAMNGRAWADSDGPGSGSTFWLALPSAGRP